MVRHGQSEGNVKKAVQSTQEDLTPLGQTQVELLAQRFKNIPVDYILCSTTERAKKTSKTINQYIQAPFQETGLLQERLQPSRFHGLPRSSQEFQEFDKLRTENAHDQNWRFEDGETFYDLKSRIVASKELIESLPHEHILVVTHGIFLKNFLGYILFEGLYDPTLSQGLMKMVSENTGVSVFEVKKLENGYSWTVLTWNDYSHLPK